MAKGPMTRGQRGAKTLTQKMKGQMNRSKEKQRVALGKTSKKK